MDYQDAEHTIALNDGTRIDLYVHYGQGAMIAPGSGAKAKLDSMRVFARVDSVERDTGIIASAPPDWSSIERLVREWIALKHPW